MKLRNELNGIGNNINQAVKKLHTLHQVSEFRDWIIIYKDGIIYGLTYVDHRTACVFNGSTLGKPYSAKGVLERCGKSVAGEEKNNFNITQQYSLGSNRVSEQVASSGEPQPEQSSLLQGCREDAGDTDAAGAYVYLCA